MDFGGKAMWLKVFDISIFFEYRPSLVAKALIESGEGYWAIRWYKFYLMIGRD